MITLLKRLAILVALWLAATIGLFVHFNTRSEEQMEADIQAIAGPLDAALASAFSIGSPEFEPLPADHVMRAETQTTLAEVEALYDELIAIREATAAAHTDEWEKRWARDAVTLAEMAKEHAIEAIERARADVERPFGEAPKDRHMVPQAVSGRLASARSVAALQKDLVEAEIETAREKLGSASGAPHHD